MGKILDILKRDIRRIFTNWVAILVLFGIFLLPSLYAWFNIAANYDPYSSTEGIKVAVVNLDEKSSAMGINLDAGKELVEELSKNKKLGWTFLDYDKAIDGVKSGDYYAAIVVPKNFSSSLLSIASGEISTPVIEYFVNEKKNAIAPKITDAGITTIENTMNMQFSQTVSRTLSKILKSVAGEIKKDIDSEDVDILSSLNNTYKNLNNLLNVTKSVKNQMDLNINLLDKASKKNEDIISKVDLLKLDLKKNINILKNTDDKIEKSLSNISSAAISLINEIKLLDIFSKDVLDLPYERIYEKNKKIGILLKDSKQLLRFEDEIMGDIQESVPDFHILYKEAEKIRANIEKKQEFVKKIIYLNSDTGKMLGDLKSGKNISRDFLKRVEKSILDIEKNYGDFISKNYIQEYIKLPKNSDFADKVILEIKNINIQGKSVISSAEISISDVMDEILKAKNSIGILKKSEIYQKLLTAGDLNPEQVADFIKSPANLETISIYPVKNYGSAMTPFYTNLAIWVGGIVLIAILKLEVDTEGFSNISSKEKYFSRLLLFVLIGIVQSVIVSLGDILFLKVQCERPLLLVLSSVLCSIAYVNIIFSLSLTLKHIGKALCVLLIILQIPGGSGTYPIEMMPEFFQKIFPLLPFNYGIDIFRQCMFGMYPKDYIKDLVMLLTYIPVSLLIGIYMRPALFNLNALFDRKLGETGFMVFEDEEENKNSLNMIVEALVSNPKIRKDIVKRAADFNSGYEKKIKRGFFAIFLLPLLFLILMFNMESKIVFLILWIASIVVIDGYLIFVEYVHDKLNRQMETYSKDDEELKKSLDIFGQEDKK